MIESLRWVSGATARAVALAALIFPMLSATPATAAAHDLAQELLDEMHRKGDVSDERYEELKKKHAHSHTSPASASADPSDWNVYWNDGFRFERTDNAIKLKFGGRIQNDWAAIGYTKGIENDGFHDDGFGTEFRRARIYFEGTFYERAFFKAQYDFADGDTDFNDVYMGLNLTDDWDFRVGHFKEPFSLEQQTSSKYLQFMERGTPDALVPGRNSGFMLQGRPVGDALTLALGFFVVTDDFGDRAPDGWDDDDGYDLTARITGAPLYAEDGGQVVHLGFSYSHGFRSANQPVTYASRPEVHLADELIETPDIPADQEDKYALEAATVLGPFSAQGEYIHTFVNPHGFDKQDYWGLYLQSGFFVTGEHRNYDTKTGSFGRLTPKRPFNPGAGDWGALELAMRYSHLDLSDHGFNPGGKLDDLTLGVNWYLYSNLRVLLNYVHGSRSTGGNVDAVQWRFQIDF